ncbi:MAG: hypothetical protein QNL60_06010 [Flavobacteriales bacterium]
MKKQFGILLKSFGVILISIIISSGNSFAGSQYKYSQVVENEIEEVEESINVDVIFHTSDSDNIGLAGISFTDYVPFNSDNLHPCFKTSSIEQGLFRFIQHKQVKSIPIYLLNCSLIVYS